MDFLTSWIFEPEFWASVGIFLIIVELMIGSGIAVAFAGAAFIHAGLLVYDEGFFTSIKEILIWYATMSVFFSFMMQWFYKDKNTKPDINDY